MSDLKPNPENPRLEWTPAQAAAFADSLRTFGDLSGIILNRTTGHLVGGHKRAAALPQEATIWRTEQPRDEQGTVATGHLHVDGARFAFREVEWDEQTEAAANLAANRWHAEWDWPKVGDIVDRLKGREDALLGVTGFSGAELAQLAPAGWTAPEAETDGLAPPPKVVRDGRGVVMTPDQYAVLVRVKKALAANGKSLSDSGVALHVCEVFLATPEA